MGSEKARGCLELIDSMDLYSIVKLKNLDGNIYEGRHGHLGVGNVKSMNEGIEKCRGCNEINCRDTDKIMTRKITVITPSELTNGKHDSAFAFQSDRLTRRPVFTTGEGGEPFRKRKADKRLGKGSTGLGFNLLDLFLDKGVAPEFIDTMRKGKKKYKRNRFRIGDMVWGKVKSHPWWPGLILNEAFASPSVFDTKIEGCLLVAFFGDGTYNWFDPAELISFDRHFVKKSKQTKAQDFLVAVKEAVAEFNRRAALGLACRCRNPSNFQRTDVQGVLKVDVSGYEPGGLYSMEQIQKAREDFQTSETLSFVQQLAMNPGFDAQGIVDYMKNAAKVLAYRRAVFNEFDETYAQAFGVQPGGFGDSMTVSNRRGKLMAQGIWRRSTDKVSITVDKKLATAKVRSVESPGNSVPFETTIEENASDQPSKKRLRPDSPIHARKKHGTHNHEVKMSMKKVTGKSDVAGKQKAIEVDDKDEKRMEEANSRMKHLKGSITMNKKPAIAKVRSVESPSNSVPLETTIEENASDQPSKKRPRPDSPLQAKKKHDTHNHLVKMSMKKVTGKSDVAVEERTGKQMAIEVDDKDEKRMEEANSRMKHLQGSPKEPDGLTTAAEPTMLVMKFPPQSSMPSVPELKLRFSRFPSLDTSSVRVFWNSSTCRVVFMNKNDAEAAYGYAASKTLFGTKVRYRLQALEASAPKFAGSDESRKQDVEEALGTPVGITSSPSTNVHVHTERCQQAMNDKNYQTTTSNVDISSDMLNLLAKCSNIVADVKKAFGYVPIL